MNLFICVSFMILIQPAFSQGNAEADLSIELIENIPPLTPPGDLGTFKFMVTNHGPTSIEPPLFYGVFATPIPFVIGNGEAIFFVESSNPGNDCVVEWGIPDPAPGFPLVILFRSAHPPLASGGVEVCEIQYWINPDFDFPGDERISNGRQFQVEWQVRTINLDDSNLDNNSITLNFLFFASPIPTLSHAGMAAMISALFVAFILLWRRVS